MRRLAKIAALTVLAVMVWSALVVAATLQGWGRQPLIAAREPAAFMRAAKTQMLADHPGNVAFVLLENGQVFDQYFASRGSPVDRETLFQVASLSKWITAWGVMILVESGRLDLDAPVETYLTRWKLPPSDYDNKAVTIRRLLSHTAGLSDGLGYLGFAPDQPIQTLEDSLTHAADAAPGASGSVAIGAAPGSGWRYSGGGYTLLQLVIEEVTGETFAHYMQRAVLNPLGMRRSTYAAPSTENLATFYDEDGSPGPRTRYTATGAASLYTSAADLSRFIAAHLPGPGGEPAGRRVLTTATLETMRAPAPNATLFGRDHWGLGLILYAPNGRGGHVIGHDGGNAPAINTSARFDPASGAGIIVLETGDPSLASRLAEEWTFWHTGEVGLPLLRILRWMTMGAVVIVFIGALLAWRTWRGSAD